MSEMFDPAAFLDGTTDQASERRPPIPAGEYLATIADLTMEFWESRNKFNTDGTPKSGLKAKVSLLMQLPQEVQDFCKVPELQLTDSPVLDMTMDKTGLDYSAGKNNRLRQYREATNLNVSGQPFSPRMLIGRMVKVRVSHEEYQGVLQERISGVTKPV